MLALRIKKAVRNGATLVVADPRAIWLTKLAKRHLQLRPGSDVWLLNAIMHVILEEGLQDDAYIAAHCEDFESVREVVARYTPEEAERVTGVPADAIRATAREYASERHAAIFYTLGITEHACGVDNIWSLANLVLMTGHLGYESTGLNALRGQNNVQGLNDSGANPHYFPGYQPWDDPEVRAKFADAWGVDLPERAGFRLDQMMSGLHDGRVKALYLIGENPAQTEPNAKHVEEGLAKLEFMVAQDLFLNETSTRFANVVLPASSFAEKDGTFTNTERRINRVRAAVPCPGNARGDREIVIDARARARLRLARVPGRRVGLERARRPLAELVRRPLSADRGARDPVAVHRRSTTRERSSCTRITRRCRTGRASSIPSSTSRRSRSPTPTIRSCCPRGERCTTTTRAAMTMREDGITDKQVEPFFEIAPEDASALGVTEGEWVRLVSRRGDIQARAQFSERVYPGLVWMAIHFAEATGEHAHPRRRRLADRDARVQGLRGPAGARLSSLAPAFMEPLLRGRFGRPYFYLEQCETTQRMLDAAQPEGRSPSARSRRQGAGRMGRTWEAPARSSILVSVLLRPPSERRAAELTLVAGVATAIAVERATGLAAQIKWPNDVMLDRRKVAGGIAELKDGAVVLGIGLNVTQAPDELPAETKAPAGSLRSSRDGCSSAPRSSPTCCSSSSSATTPGATAGWTRSTTISARATSSAAAGSRVDGVDGVGADDPARRPAGGLDRLRPGGRRERRGPVRALTARPACSRSRAGVDRPRRRAG